MPDEAFQPSFCDPTGAVNVDQPPVHQAVAGAASGLGLVVIPAVAGKTPYLVRSVLSAGAAVNADLLSMVADPLRSFAFPLSGLASYHRMNEAAGNLVDTGPNGIVGVANGAPTYSRPAMLQSDPDTSIGFAGLVDFFDLGIPGVLDFTDEMSMFVVFRYGGVPGAFPTDYMVAGHGDAGGATWKWVGQLQSGTTGITLVSADANNNAVINGTFPAGRGTLDDGLPHSFGMTYKRNAVARAFVDGVKVQEVATANVPMRPSPVDHVSIGCIDALMGGARFFLGDIQALITYSVARTEAEMIQMDQLALVASASQVNFFTGHPLGAGSDEYNPVGWPAGMAGGDIRVIGSNGTPINAEVFGIQK